VVYVEVLLRIVIDINLELRYFVLGFGDYYEIVGG